MKSFVALLAVVAVVAADVSHVVGNPESTAQILKQSADVGPEGYQFQFETSNGINAQESGALKNVGTDAEALEVQGANTYTAPNGERINLVYVANENGYQPTGDHLPVPPPPQEIPEYILRALEYIRTHPPKEEPIRRV